MHTQDGENIPYNVQYTGQAMVHDILHTIALLFLIIARTVTVISQNYLYNMYILIIRSDITLATWSTCNYPVN